MPNPSLQNPQSGRTRPNPGVAALGCLIFCPVKVVPDCFRGRPVVRPSVSLVKGMSAGTILKKSSVGVLGKTSAGGPAFKGIRGPGEYHDLSTRPRNKMRKVLLRRHCCGVSWRHSAPASLLPRGQQPCEPDPPSVSSLCTSCPRRPPPCPGSWPGSCLWSRHRSSQRCSHPPA